MHLVLLLSIACDLPAVANDRIEPDQFARVLRGLHGKIRDVSLVCEGTEELLQPELLDPGRTTRLERFQAAYDYRSDNAMKLDLYKHGDKPDSIFLRQTMALLGRDLEKYAAAPDQKRIAKVTSTTGNPSSLNVLGSPHAIIYLWYFRYHIDHFSSMNFKHLGWDIIDGHKCIKIQLDFLPNMGNSQLAYRYYWIDLERGGHPLKIENYRQGRLVTRTRDIQLARFSIQNNDYIWIPVDGIRDNLMWRTTKGFVYSQKPISQAKYHVVKSTVRFNQDLPDHVFTLRKKGEPSPGRRPLELSREFDQAAEQPPADRSDPAAVRQRLDAKLAEAERQATMITASSRALTSWDSALVTQISLAFIGMFLLFGAFLARRRSRRWQ